MGQPFYPPNNPWAKDVDRWYRVVTDKITGINPPVFVFGRLIADASYQLIAPQGIFRTPTAPVALEAVSTSPEDNPAGTGAGSIICEIINDQWAREKVEVILNGQTPAPLPKSGLRLLESTVKDSNTYADPMNLIFSHAGDITIQEAGAGPIWGIIDSTIVGRGQSDIGCFTIPFGEVGFIESIFINVGSTKVADAILWVRENADVVTAPFSTFRQTVSAGEFINGKSAIFDKIPAGPFFGPADIGIFGKVDTPGGEINSVLTLTTYKIDRL